MPIAEPAVPRPSTRWSARSIASPTRSAWTLRRSGERTSSRLTPSRSTRSPASPTTAATTPPRSIAPLPWPTTKGSRSVAPNRRAAATTGVSGSRATSRSAASRRRRRTQLSAWAGEATKARASASIRRERCRSSPARLRTVRATRPPGRRSRPTPSGSARTTSRSGTATRSSRRAWGSARSGAAAFRWAASPCTKPRRRSARRSSRSARICSRHRAGHRAGALRGRGLRRQRPAALGKHDGVPRPDRRRRARVQARPHGHAHEDEPARREGRWRGGHDRLDASGGQRRDRRALAARDQAPRHAAHAGEDLAGHPEVQGGGKAMITHPFSYQAPSTIEEAIATLGRSRDGKVLAGGHSLLPLMKLGLAQPDTLVDIRKIASLRDIRAEADGTIVVGTLATHRSIAEDRTIGAKLAALAEAAAAVGDPQVRSRGTIGGSLAHADPAADEPAPTLAFDAIIRA